MGVGVAAVHDAVDIDLLRAQVLGHVQQAEQMVNVAVHAAVAGQAHKVDGLARVNGRFHITHQNVVLAHTAVPDALGDEGELLVHDAARTNVGVAHLAVAHLAVGQAHVHAGGPDGGVGVLGKQPVQVGRFRRHNGVAVGLVRHPAKPIQDAEHYRFLCHKVQSPCVKRACMAGAFPTPRPEAPRGGTASAAAKMGRAGTAPARPGLFYAGRVQPSVAAFTMAANFSAFRAAPPIRPPSTSGLLSSSAALPSFMLPPY